MVNTETQKVIFPRGEHGLGSAHDGGGLGRGSVYAQTRPDRSCEDNNLLAQPARRSSHDRDLDDGICRHLQKTWKICNHQCEIIDLRDLAVVSI